MNGRTSDDIRRDIERKRGEMDRTVDTLERKLSPGRLLDHALWMVRGRDMGPGSDTVKAASDRAVGFARQHPVPVALMSAGAAWLAAESRRPHTDVGAGTYAPAEGRVGPYLGDALDEGSLRDDGPFTSNGRGDGASATARAKEKTGELTHRVTDRLADAKHEAGDRLRDAKDSVRHRVDAAGSGARERMHAAGERGSELAHRARGRYDTTLDQNPLAIGAATFGLGLAAGLAAPTTRWEDQRLGGAADTVKAEARSIGRDTARAARSAGSAALSTAQESARSNGLIDEVKDRAKRVASDAADAAKQRVREEGLTMERLQQRAKRTASSATRQGMT